MKWYLRQGNKPVGPYPESQLKEALLKGDLRPQELIWQQGANEWKPALMWAEFKGLDVPAFQKVGEIPEDQTEWVVLQMGPEGRPQTKGPLSMQEIRQALKAGILTSKDSLWTKGMTGWARIDSRPELVTSLAHENLSPL